MPDPRPSDEPAHPHPHPRTPSSSRQTQRTKHIDSEASSDQPARKSPTAERENRPPAKRSRKAINCEPCRNSKLKCDRGRPCSSCVLRGTALHCYQGAAEDAADDNRGSRIDPYHEIARIRHSLATLEAYVIRGSTTNGQPPPPLPSDYRPDASVLPTFKSEADGDDVLEKSAPGLLAQKGQGGLYAGPTSMVAHFLSVKSSSNETRDGDGGPPRSADEGLVVPDRLQYDDDLLNLLPQIHIIEGLVDYYFEYCNWVYRHVHPPSFKAAWNRFKSGHSADRLVLATLCVIMGVAIRYLPESHSLLTSIPQSHNTELGERYYEISRDALTRYRSECRKLSLELIEVLLIRTHYLTLSKDKSEEIYSICGELVSIGTAMGLHRDPDKWNMPRDVAERRRWAWWHIILLERWQCFLFGRPLSIAAHHYDTTLPSPVDHEAIDHTNRRSFEPNLHLFRLAAILGDIVDDAVSIRPVPYERVMDRDRQLVQWMDALPKDLDMDEFRLARALSNPTPNVVRTAVQSVIIRSSYYHIRFTLHRPYAASAHDLENLHSPSPSSRQAIGGSNAAMDERMAQSLDIAVNAADKVIQLSAQAQSERLRHGAATVPGHIHWGPFHCFSAAMFFSFQLIANPDQPGANLFRANIRRVLEILSMSRGVVLADKATAILNALAPLYESSPPGESELERETKKKTVLSTVRGLAFPYHDSPVHARNSGDSPATYSRRTLESPFAGQNMQSIANSHLAGPSHMHGSQPPLDSVPSPINHRPPLSSTGYPNGNGNTSPQHSMHNGINFIAPQHHQSSPPPPLQHHPSAPLVPQHQYGSENDMPQYNAQIQQARNNFYPAAVPVAHPEYNDVVPFPQGNEEMPMHMWGASVGFGQSEWSRFIDSMQRPDGTRM